MAWCDASARRMRPDGGLRLAAAVADRLNACGIASAVGTGANRLLAAMAAQGAPSGGAVRLTRAAVPGCLWPLPLNKLWGIPPEGLCAGLRNNLSTIGDLAAIGPLRAETVFGPDGPRLWRASYGRDDEPVPLHYDGPLPEIAVEQPLDPGDASTSGGTLALLAAAEGVSARLRRSGFVAAGLLLRIDPHGARCQAALAPPTDQTLEIFRAAVRLGAPGCTPPASGRRVRLEAWPLEPVPRSGLG